MAGFSGLCRAFRIGLNAGKLEVEYGSSPGLAANEDAAPVCVHNLLNHG
jgi:hypothetical protein